ncbi:hypothetical protein [Sicyoidochytrium minutum DNA virus]|nr:hypothetical protein [Sicyoidochytrium minutum DNA virus]
MSTRSATKRDILPVEQMGGLQIVSATQQRFPLGPGVQSKEDGTNDKGVDIDGGTVPAYSRASRTIDWVIMWFTFVGLIVYFIVMMTAYKDIKTVNPQGIAYVFMSVALLSAFSAGRLFFHTSSWMIQMAAIIGFWFLIFIVFLSIWVRIGTDPSEDAREQIRVWFYFDLVGYLESLQNYGQGRVDPQCASVTIVALRNNPIFTRLIDAISADVRNEKTIRKLKRDLAKQYHPNACIKSGCQEICTSTWKFLEEELARVGYTD